MLSENSKKKLQKLAGIIVENLRLVPDPSGRSDANTLSWYVEEYLLNLLSNIVNTLDTTLSAQGYTVAISQGNTKMQENSLVTKIIISSPNKQHQEYLITAIANFEQGTSTSVSVSNSSITQKFDLASHHKGTDVNTFIQNVVTNIFNSLQKL